MKKNDRLYCPLCRSVKTKKIYSGTDRVVSEYRHGDRPCDLSLFRCRECGARFLGKVAYASEIVHEAYWDMLTRNLPTGFAVQSGSDAISMKLLDKYRKTNRLLEIGCGDAALLNQARADGWRVTGIDISRKAVELARERYGLDIINGQLDEETVAWLGERSFDIILMWGVIEHLAEPLRVLRLSRALLRAGGALVLYTPNADSLFHRLARLTHCLTGGAVSFFMERVTIAMHTLYLTPGSLRRALRDCGFSAVEVRMASINLDFIFQAHSQFWWSNPWLLWGAKRLQRIAVRRGLNSHLIVVAEKA